jgi:hypothetical protein
MDRYKDVVYDVLQYIKILTKTCIYNMTKTQYKMKYEEGKVKFISTVGTLGEDRMIINIPKKHHKDVKKLLNDEDVDVKITIERIDW